MNRQFFKAKLATMLTACSLCLTACAKDINDIYHSAQTTAADVSFKGTPMEGMTFRQATYFFAIYVSDMCKAYVPYVVIGSWLLGLLIITVVKKEKLLIRKAVLGFGVAIPAVAVLFGYGISILANWFSTF